MAIPGTTVKPAFSGTIQLGSLGAKLSVGRDAVRAAVESFLRLPERVWAVDIETEGVDHLAMRVKAITVASDNHAIILDPRDEDQFKLAGELILAATRLIFHNSSFDVPVLLRHGVMRQEDVAKVWDTLITARMAEPDEYTSKSLTAAAERYLGIRSEVTIDKSFKIAGLTKSNGFKLFDLDRPVYVHGAAFDAVVTRRLLHPVCKAALKRLIDHPFGEVYGTTKSEAIELLEREQIINRMFLRRAGKGLRVDLEFVDRYRAEAAERMRDDEEVLLDAGVTPGYGKSLVDFLEAGGLLPKGFPRTGKTGAVSTAKAHLATLAHPVAQAFVRQKETTKVDRDYLQKVVDLADINDRIHPGTNILGAATGRMSMGSPPLQQFPGPARGIILADEGDSLTSIDWSQIEPVVMANVARDEQVLRGYEDGTSDLYTEVSELANITRKQAKVVVLALLYGEGMKKLAAQLDITESDAYALRDAVFRAMPRTERLTQKLRRAADEYRLIFTISGRMIPIPTSMWEGRASVATHKGINFFCQGSAYDVLAESLVRIEAAGLGNACYLALHDELVVSSEVANDVEKIMVCPPERLVKLAGRTPVLRVDRKNLGERWADA